MSVFQDPHQQKILILDFGAQYTQLIGRCVRELGVYCEIFPFDADPKIIEEFDAKGVILSGSHASTYEDHGTLAPDIIFDSGLPVLGICYGMQTLVSQLGGTVENASHHEYGHAVVSTCAESRLTGKSGLELEVWMSHGDRVSELPAGFGVIGTTPNCPYAIIADEERNYYGVQFHPEVTHTTDGNAMFSRFVHDICGCGSDWVASNIIENQLQSIRTEVGNDHVILALSGGVDSSVVAAVLRSRSITNSRRYLRGAGAVRTTLALAPSIGTSSAV